MQYDLVFEGGGAKGMVFVGAMQEFERRGHTYDRLLGTSAGAIAATLLAAGYTSGEILAALSEQVNGQPVFATFMGIPAEFDDMAVQNSATLALLKNIDIPIVPDFIEDKVDEWLAKMLMGRALNLFSLIERGGWYSADNFLTWLRRKLDEGEFQGKRRNFSDMTLAEFQAAAGRDLSLVASNTTGERMLVLNHNTAPNLPLVWAVRMSMSIPMVWPEVEWQATWGTYLDKDITVHHQVAGGLLSNFPIELFISDDDHITAVMGEKKEGSRILGLLIDESLEVEGAPPGAASTTSGFSFGQLQLIQRLNRLVNTATGAHDKMVLEAFDRLVVRLPAKGYGTVEFDMSQARREALIATGRRTMREYLNFRDEASFGIAAFGIEDEPTYEIDVADHANRVASHILEW